MSARLPDHVDFIAAAPSGIQKLRGLILELAVRGKLVPQDPDDEPASELLKRIANERARLVAEGKIRKGQPLASVGEDEYPFMLPKGWGWMRLGQIGDWGAGATPLRSNSQFYGGAIPWFKSGELTADFISESEEHITAHALKACSLRQNQPGDVLVAMYGATIGKTAILSVAATTNQAVCACTPNTGVDNRYLLLLLRALKPNFVGQGAGGAQPNISREKIIATVSALPPEAEQHRIVTKVDELMALCDQLEAEQTDAASAHAKLVETLLGTLTQSRDAGELAANWQRLSQHFGTLFSTETSLDTLKQTILQLAVIGKLVPQDPNDEPASELIKVIAKERARLEAKGVRKKSSPASRVGEHDQPFALPSGWLWTTVDTVSFVGTGTTPSRTNTLYYDPPLIPWVTSGETRNPFLAVTAERVSPLALKETNLTLFPVGTLIVAMYGQGKTRGQISELQIEATTNQACSAIVPGLSDDSFRKYIKLFFEKIYDEIREQAAGGAQPNLNVGKIKATLISLPPLAEQHRIVAKVDELMALCDRLKADLAESRARQARLSATLIDAALQVA